MCTDAAVKSSDDVHVDADVGNPWAARHSYQINSVIDREDVDGWLVSCESFHSCGISHEDIIIPAVSYEIELLSNLQKRRKSHIHT